MVPEVITLPLYTEARLQPLVRWFRQPWHVINWLVYVAQRGFSPLSLCSGAPLEGYKDLTDSRPSRCEPCPPASIRSAPVRHCHLDQPDIDNRIWTVPADVTKGRRDELDQPVSTTRRCDPAGTDDQDTPMLRRRFDRFSEMGDRINGRHQGQQPSRCINRPNTRPYSTDRSPTPLANPESSTQD